MIARRNLLTSTVTAGLAGLAASGPAFAAGVPDDAGQTPDRELVKAVGDGLANVTSAISSTHSFQEIAPIRAAQKQWLTQTGKFPDFIEVGVNPWFEVYDWHIRWQQPLNLGRDNQNRRTIGLIETAVVLRLDLLPNFIGQPYDKQ